MGNRERRITWVGRSPLRGVDWWDRFGGVSLALLLVEVFDAYRLPMCREQLTLSCMKSRKKPPNSLQKPHSPLSSSTEVIRNHVLIHDCNLIGRRRTKSLRSSVATGTRFNPSVLSETSLNLERPLDEESVPGHRCRMRAECKAVALRDRDALPGQPVDEQPSSCFSNSGHRPRSQSQRESPYHSKHWTDALSANRNAR